MQSCDAEGHMVLGQTIAQFHGGDLLVTWQQQVTYLIILMIEVLLFLLDTYLLGTTEFL